MKNTKEKGSRWEREAVEILNEYLKDSIFKKVPGSGAIGTQIGESILTGDLRGEVKSFPRKFKIECKTGYGGSTQMTIKKEWLDKIKEESSKDMTIPLLLAKFSGARRGVRYFAVIDLETLIYLFNHTTDLFNSLE